jgi:hypothetical protein
MDDDVHELAATGIDGTYDYMIACTTATHRRPQGWQLAKFD